MAKPTTRQELVDYALRQLGAPVLEINIADEQLDDLLDDTIQYFQERHYDGVARTYLKYEFTEEDIKRGADYNPFYQAGITTAATTYPGASGPTVDQFVENSQYIKIPPHIIGIEKVFTPREATGNGFFPGSLLGPGNSAFYGASYGFVGGLGGFGGYDVVSWFVAKQWLETINHLYNPEASIRFNKRMDRLYLDINWNRLAKGDVIIIECYRALDPEAFCEVYNDSWVKKYFVARCKKQWGQNLIKFRGTKLPGGIEMNGREIYDEGVKEIDEIKRDMSSYYEEPPLDMIG